MINMFHVNMSQRALKAMADTLYSGYITQGPRVEEFEAALRDYLTASQVVSVNSGTSALHLALHLAKQPGKPYVITTPMTCSATNLPILHNQLIPLWADIDPQTGLIDIDSVKTLFKQYGDNVSAVLAVDWGGMPCDYDELVAIAKPYGAKVIIDAAHSFGAIYKTEMVAESVVDFVCLSFQAIKHLTTGDGGAIVCRSRDDYQRAKLLRWFGLDREAKGQDLRMQVDIPEPGYKFNMNDINAALGLANIGDVTGILLQHRMIARIYDEWLPEKLRQHHPKYSHLSSAWLYTVICDSATQRHILQLYLGQQGVETSQVHRDNREYACFAPFTDHDNALPGVDSFKERMLCLPCHAGMSREDALEVCRLVTDCLEEAP